MIPKNLEEVVMKRFGLIAALTFGIAGVASAQDAIFGTWQTIPDDNGNYGHIQIGACADKICGVLVRAYNGAGEQIESENVGRALVWDMENVGGGEYDNGKVYSPDRDKTYNGEMELSGDQLNVKGCVLGICRSGGVWTRVN